MQQLPLLIMRASGDAFDLSYCRSREFDELAEDDDGQARQARAAGFHVAYTVFPGLHMDSTTAMHALVVVAPRPGLDSASTH